MQKVSVGICAYNEGQNIGRLLKKLTQYPFEIIVVASGCTDDTVQAAKSFNYVKVIEQKQREGKASAVNVFLSEAKGEILVLESADTLPSDFTFKYLLKPFELDQIGMVGAHPVPINPLDTYINRVGHLLWRTHHYMALKYPKAGEVCAFRNVVKCINPKTVVDEVSIEQQIHGKGFKIAYVPEAIIFNKAPSNVKDFMKQRERIYLGHMRLSDEGYTVATMNQIQVLLATIESSKNLLLLAYAAWLEGQARYQARIDYTTSNEYFKWDMIETTKELK